MEDIEDVSIDISEGYVMMDISILNELMSKQPCKTCKGKIIRVEQKRTGAMLSYHLYCSKDHKSITRTQKMVRKQPEGNVAIANAVFCSGITFTAWTRICLCLNLLSFSSTTFYTIIANYVRPVILRTWTKARNQVMSAIKISPEKSIWVADGQFDSPGYSAKYLVETVMCALSGKVIDFVLFQKGLFPGEMEAKALRYLLNRLEDDVLEQVEIICTDRNNCVRKLLREEFPDIDHQYDIWHLAKSLKKRMKLLFKKSKVLLDWVKSVGNHLWWCAQTCGGCADTIIYKWQSLLKHVRNNHENCEHDAIDPEVARKKKWISEPADIRTLSNFISDKKLNEDLKHCTQYVHTGNLESVHSKANVYRPKKYYFSYLGMVLRTILAYLDHNANLNKTLVSEVSEYSKETGQWMARKVYQKNDYTWLKDISKMVLANLKNHHIEITQEEIDLMLPFELPQNIAPTPKVSIDNLNMNRLYRFD